MSNHIPVFCATDENYAPFASIMMKSVLMHTDSFIDFYIMDGGITKKTKKLIEKDIKKYPNKKLHFVDMTKYNLSRFPNLSYYSLNTFSRYFIPWIAPNLKKVIYLDVDIVVKKDIIELYNQDLENYSIAAMPEDFLNYSKNLLKNEVYPEYNIESNYFNAGVLLLDIPKLIQFNFTEKALKLTKELSDKLRCADQDILNILFENNYKKLNLKFDFFPDYLPEYKKENPQFTLIEPTIIRYIAIKPWNAYSANQQDFDAVLKTSVFYKRITRRYRSKRISKFYLFGFIPLFTRVISNK